MAKIGRGCPIMDAADIEAASTTLVMEEEEIAMVWRYTLLGHKNLVLISPYLGNKYI